MKTKFTKGKWLACCGSYEVAVLNSDKFIETLITDTGPASIPDDEEAKANQDLIASAPDMYKEMLDFVNGACEEDIETARNRFSLVLKKARGE